MEVARKELEQANIAAA
jgi:CheY-like chemotaxis protein